MYAESLLESYWPGVYGLWYINYQDKYLKWGFLYPMPFPFPKHKVDDFQIMTSSFPQIGPLFLSFSGPPAAQ